MTSRWPSPYVLALAGVLLGLTALRMWFAAVTELAPDEAYYWAWSNRLAGGYLDHGPAVAWLTRMGTVLFGHTSLGVRFGALLCSLVTAWSVFLITRQLTSSERQGFWVAVLLAVTPLSSAGAVVHTPDAALVAFWALALWFGLQAYRTERLVFFFAAGAAMGLAILAKMTGLLLLAGWGVFLGLCKAGRQRLAGPGPAVSMLTAAAVAMPSLIWNLQHKGGAFAFQWAHATGGISFDPLGFLAFLGGQAGVVSPLLWLAIVATLAVVWVRSVRFGRPEVFFLWSFSAPVFGLFLLLSAVHKVEANWPAVVYLAALPAAAWAWTGGRWYLKRIRIWTAAALGLAVLSSLLIHIQVLAPFLPVEPGRDPTARLRGWEELATEAAAEAEAIGATLASEGYGPVSELAFYTGREVVYEPNAARPSQYDVWDDPRPATTLLYLQPRTTPGTPGLCRRAAERWTLIKKPRERWRRADDFRWWVCDLSNDDT